LILNFSFKFARNLLIVILLIMCTAFPANAAVYTYDNLNRLISVTYDNGQKVIYTYDAGGNILSVVQLVGVNGQVYLEGRPVGIDPSLVSISLVAGDTTCKANILPDGNFTFSSIDPGTYVLKITYPGYLHIGREVIVTDGKNLEIGKIYLLTGDISRNNRVDLDDLIILRTAYGTVGANLDADLNGNGKVDLIDLVYLARNYGREGFFD